VEFQAALGRAIRDARVKKGWTQDDLGAAADTDRAYVGNLEIGRRNPSFSTLSRIADALGEKLSDVLADAERYRLTPGDLELRDEKPTGN